MASGHVNRANRPNTWLHRPMLQSEVSPCQPGAVHTWPKADLPEHECDVRFRGWSGARVAEGGTSACDPSPTSSASLRQRACPFLISDLRLNWSRLKNLWFMPRRSLRDPLCLA